MANLRAKFVTKRVGNYGSSLYYVTAHWIIRCSGNSAEGRRPTTFIRKREIAYITGTNSSTIPTVGSFPREGGHDGNSITRILDVVSADQVPDQWVSANGVSWQTAVAEVFAAMEYARRTQFERASREVGRGDFAKD